MKERTIIIIAAVFFIAMSFSPLIFMKNPNKYNYNDFKIQKTATGWATWAYKGDQPYYLQLRHDPKTLEDVKIDSKTKDLILSKPSLALTIDPNLTSVSVLGAMDIANILGRRLGLYSIHVVGATTEYANDATPVITCNNVSSNLNVALLQLGNQTQVSIKNNCILVEGATEEDISRASDRLVYQVLTVMP